MAAYSRVGASGALWMALALAGAGLDRARRPLYWRAARAVPLSLAANTLVKLVVRRSRPVLEDLPAVVAAPVSLSYPSAHAATSFAAARALGRALPRGPLVAAAAAMALSRPYLGLHYPSDAAAGALLGWHLAELTP